MIVEVTRGGLVESVHNVVAAAVTARGDVLFSSGDIEAPVFLRSSAKPFIAAAAVAAGAHKRFGLDARELAVMSASHKGESFHVDAVKSILRKIGLDESALQCGVQEGRGPSALHNNCSGKHAGVLALCLTIGSDPTTYMELTNAAQVAILAFCARISDDDPATWPIGIDGCGIPVYATSIRKAAMAFARFASLEELSPGDAAALHVVRDAMIAHPEYVAGTGEFDTMLMAAGAGSIACKFGAEGVHAVAYLPKKAGFASKVLDGTGGRARPPVTMAALRALGSPTSAAAELQAFAHPIVYNRAGRAVGAIRVSSDFAILKASTSS